MAGHTGTDLGINSVERARLELEEFRNRWLGLLPHQREALVIIVREIDKVGPRACRILSMQAERLSVGSAYGDFEKGRKWGKEALEEVLDQLHYHAAALLELNEEEDK